MIGRHGGSQFESRLGLIAVLAVGAFTVVSAPPPDLNQATDCVLGKKCIISITGTGWNAYTDARSWQPTSVFPVGNWPVYFVDPANYWSYVVDDPGNRSGSELCATTPGSAFLCPESPGPLTFGTLASQRRWTNPRGGMNNQPYEYELCSQGATGGRTTGTYALCWGENPDMLAEDPPFTHIGSFSMYGPEATDYSCILGQACDLIAPGRFGGKSAAKVIKGDTESVCYYKNYHTEFVDFGGGFRDEVESVRHEDGAWRKFSFNIAARADNNRPNKELENEDSKSGLYRVCWSISLEALTRETPDYLEQVKGVDMGPLVLYGPVVHRDGVTLTAREERDVVIHPPVFCALTLPCTWKLEGRFYDQMPWGIFLSEEDQCGTSAVTLASLAGDTWVNPTGGAASSTSSFDISLGVPTVGMARLYYLCWGSGARVQEDYTVRMGTLIMAGPRKCEEPCICYKGDICTILLETDGLTGPSAIRNRIVFLEPGSVCGGPAPLPYADLDPQPPELLVQGGNNYGEFIHDKVAPGLVTDGIAKYNYTLCWGAGLDSSITRYDYQFGDFNATYYAGAFSMLGANYRDMVCIMGLPCELRLTGISFQASNQLIILDYRATICPRGEYAEFTHSGGVLMRNQVLAQPEYATLAASGPANDTYVMGRPDGVLENGERANFLVCWSNAPADFQLTHYMVKVGFLTLAGPKKADLSCTLSRPCSLTLEGLLLEATNQILIVSAESDTCAPPPTMTHFKYTQLKAVPVTLFKNVTNPQVVSSGTGTEQVYFMGKPGSAPLGPGQNYKICWAHDPTSEESHTVFVGFFTMYGAATFSDPPCGAFVPGEDPYCVLGEECEIGAKPLQDPQMDVEALGGTNKPAFTNELMVAQKTDNCCSRSPRPIVFLDVAASPIDEDNPPVSTNPVGNKEGDSESYFLGTPSLATPSMEPYDSRGSAGDYLLCWAHNPKNRGDFNTAVGTLRVRGPSPQIRSCILGETCAITLTGQFDSHPEEDPHNFEASRLLIILPDARCMQAATSPDPPWVGLTNPTPRPRAQDITFDSVVYRTGSPQYDPLNGIPIANQPTTTYQLCWAFTPPNGVPRSWQDEEYRVRVGLFTMIGPTQGIQIACQLGSSCALQLKGVGLAATNYVVIISMYGGVCGSLPPSTPMIQARMPGMFNPKQVTDDTARDMLENTYDMGIVAEGGSYSACRVAKPQESCIGSHYRICWAHGVEKNAMGDDWPYFVDIGTFSLGGVYGTYSVECVLGSPCGFQIFGLELQISNQVLIIDASQECGSKRAKLMSFPGLRNPQRALSVSNVSETAGGGMAANYWLGRSSAGQVGSYRLCWGFNPLTPAHFKVEAGPFHFRAPPMQQSCSKKDASCYQQDM